MGRLLEICIVVPGRIRKNRSDWPDDRMEPDRQLVPASRALPAELNPSLGERAYRWLKSRAIETESPSLEQLRSEFDSVVLEEAKRLGFEPVGVSSERGQFGVRFRTLHMVDEEGLVELELNRARNQRHGQTQYRMRAHLADGTTVAVEPERQTPKEASETPVFPEANSLRASYEHLQDALAHQAEKREATPVHLQDFEEILRLAEAYELTEMPKGTLRRQIWTVAAVPLMVVGTAIGTALLVFIVLFPLL